MGRIGHKIWTRVAICGLLAGCAASPRAALEAGLDDALSNTATAQMLMAGWAAGKLPTPYTRSTLEGLQESFRQSQRELAAHASEQKQRLQASLERGQGLLQRASDLVKADKRGPAGRLALEFGHEADSLRHWRQGLQEAPADAP